MTTTTGVEFDSPLPGLGPCTSYTLDPIDGAVGLYALRSTADAVRLFLLDLSAERYGLSGVAGFRPSLAAAARAQLGAARGGEIQAFVIANPDDDGVHVNLRAPIIVDRETGRAAQVILDDQNYPIRARLVSPDSSR